MTFPEPEAYRESFGEAMRGVLVAVLPTLGVLAVALWIAVKIAIQVRENVLADVRADLATQGCVLVLEDAGEGQTWRVVCEGEGR